MAIDLYRLSVGTFLRHLKHLDGLLLKASAHCELKGIAPASLLSARLYPDMFDLTRQIQIACDFAKGTGARLAGAEPPRFEDNEDSFGSLRERIEKTAAFLRGLDPSAFLAADNRTIVIPMREKTLRMSGDSYLVDFALPNFYFHFTTAYDILRHNGVEIGKKDFVGEI